MNVYYIIITILIVVIICLIYIWRNLYKKVNELQNLNDVKFKIFLDINTRIEFADRKLKEIDSRGSFESDDEVGFFFKEIKKIQEILRVYNTIFNLNEETK